MGSRQRVRVSLTEVVSTPSRLASRADSASTWRRFGSLVAASRLACRPRNTSCASPSCFATSRRASPTLTLAAACAADGRKGAGRSGIACESEGGGAFRIVFWVTHEAERQYEPRGATHLWSWWCQCHPPRKTTCCRAPGCNQPTSELARPCCQKPSHRWRTLRRLGCANRARVMTVAVRTNRLEGGWRAKVALARCALPTGPQPRATPCPDDDTASPTLGLRATPPLSDR